MAFYVYILASQRNGTLYIGYTDDLHRRVSEHEAHASKGFMSKYNATRPVWFEEHVSRESAFTRERRTKVSRRAWKLELIEQSNPS